jgi:hypothetical protein
MSVVSDFQRPIFGPASLSVASVDLLKKYLLPVADVGFGKVSKHFRSLDTFWVLHRAFLCFHDLVPQGLAERGKLVWKRHNGSEEIMKHGDSCTLLITGL